MILTSDYLSISKILVAVDGSDPSFNASAYAIDWAKRNDAELIVLYIVSPVPYSQFEYANIGRMKEIESIEKEKAQREVVDKVKQKATENKVSVKTEVLIKYTSVVKEIVEYAEDNKVDMIVIGSRGVTGLKKLLLGSVASGVVTYSHCPVLVVK
jgi:nucleotide-binding universal stress UspA family protein